MTSASRNRRSLTTVNTSTSRLRRSARAELSSAGGRSNVIPTLTTAASRTRARVDGIASAKKLSETHPGRELHRTGLRGHRAKGSAVVTTAATAPARRRCERGGGEGGFIVTLATCWCGGQPAHGCAPGRAHQAASGHGSCRAEKVFLGDLAIMPRVLGCWAPVPGAVSGDMALSLPAERVTIAASMPQTGRGRARQQSAHAHTKQCVAAQRCGRRCGQRAAHRVGAPGDVALTGAIAAAREPKDDGLTECGGGGSQIRG